MAEPLFNLVTYDKLDDDADLDYAAASKAADYRDEVQLVDDLGMPCAFPSGQSYDNVDMRYDYSDGSVGESKVRLRHRIQMTCDGLAGSQRRKLREMMQDRAEVYFTPGHGRKTEFAYLPNEYTWDATMRHSISRSGDANQNAVWDYDRGVMRSWAATDDPRIISTPAGAGQVFEATLDNVCDIPAPASGVLWTAGGVGTAVAYSANAFGYTPAPHACRCYTTTYSVGQYFSVGVTPASYGEGVFTVTTFIRGRLPGDWRIRVYDATAAANLGELALDGDYGDWTKVTFCVPCDTTGSSNVDLQIYRLSGGNADFEVGPTAVYWKAVVGSYYASRAEWHPAGARSADVVTSATFPYPDVATLHTAFWLPEDYEFPASEEIGLFGSPSGIRDYDLVLFSYDASPSLRALYYYGYSGTEPALRATVDTLLVPGAVNTITVTLGHDLGTMYVNGVKASDTSGDQVEYQRREAPAVGDTFSIGACPYYEAQCHIPLLSLRCDREVWSADRVAWEHAASANPGALEVSVPARGRRYKIRAIPSTPSSNAGDATWSGVLELEQSFYTATLADITAKE